MSQSSAKATPVSTIEHRPTDRRSINGRADCTNSLAGPDYRASGILKLPERFIPLRPEFVAICGDDNCAAMVLADFELEHEKAMQRSNYGWFQRTVSQIVEALQRQHGKTKVRAALQKLEHLTFAERRTPADPRDTRGDRYRLNIAVINAALEAYATEKQRQCEAYQSPPPELRGGPFQIWEAPPPKTTSFLETVQEKSSRSSSNGHSSKRNPTKTAAAAVPTAKPDQVAEATASSGRPASDEAPTIDRVDLPEFPKSIEAMERFWDLHERRVRGVPGRVAPHLMREVIASSLPMVPEGYDTDSVIAEAVHTTDDQQTPRLWKDTIPREIQKLLTARLLEQFRTLEVRAP